MQCPNCGTENPGKPKFCMECGTPMPQEVTANLCGVCRQQLPDGAKICPNCGSKTSEVHLILSYQEVMDLRSAFKDAGVVTAFTRTQWAAITPPQLYAGEEVIAYIPAKQYEVIRKAVAVDKFVLNGSSELSGYLSSAPFRRQ